MAQVKLEYILLGLGAGGLAAYWYFFLRPKLPFVCPECGAQFATFGELSAHMAAVHPGVPVPYTLEVKVIEA